MIINNKEDLHITLIQSDIYWEDPEKNLDSAGKLLGDLKEKTDMIILPEMFNTGFSMNLGKCAETMTGKTLAFLKEKASEVNSMIIGSLLITEGGMNYNRLVAVSPDGSVVQYNKRHLFRLSEEYKTLSAGNKKVIVNCNGWKILPLVCYDLRFPVWSKNRYINQEYDYDLLVYVANWPKSRAAIWRSLLVARAVENQCYVIGVNRIGRDGQGTAHAGGSLIAGPDGEILASAPMEKPGVLTEVLSIAKLREFRTTFPFAPDWDHFIIHP